MQLILALCNSFRLYAIQPGLVQFILLNISSRPYATHPGHMQFIQAF
jgi:hypothetical protein